MTKKHESSWKVNVRTVKKSQATIASRWLARKAAQRVAGSPRRGTCRRYRATLRSARLTIAATDAEAGPEEAVEASQHRPRPLVFEYGDLLSEREELQGGIAATADEHADGCQDCEQEIELAQPWLLT